MDRYNIHNLYYAKRSIDSISKTHQAATLWLNILCISTLICNRLTTRMTFLHSSFIEHLHSTSINMHSRYLHCIFPSIKSFPAVSHGHHESGAVIPNLCSIDLGLLCSRASASLCASSSLSSARHFNLSIRFSSASAFCFS